MPTSLITGITGQDGAYLAQLLLGKGYRVVGLVRHSATLDFVGQRLQSLDVLKDVELVSGDLIDLSSLIRTLSMHEPEEIYHLGAQSLVATSWNEPILTGQVTGQGTLIMLEAIRIVNRGIKFYQASSSEMFGLVKEPMQNEKTPFHPRSPYAVAKVYAHWMTVNYRESFGMHASSGILFNHESPLRGIEFVTRKITDGVARVKLGLASHVMLGNLDAKRDWGHARDYVRAMWLMLQQERGGDYVVATGKTTSIREFCRVAFGIAGLEWENHVKSQSNLFRPAEVDVVCGDSTKAQAVLGWKPTISFEDMVAEMVEADLCRHSMRNNAR